MLELAKLCLIAVVIVLAWQPFFRLILLGVIVILKKLLLKSETEIGRENVPKGPGLVLTNHFTTGEEAGLLFYCLTRILGLMKVYLLYKKELEEGKNLWTKIGGLIALVFLRGAGFRPTRREQKDEVGSSWAAKKLSKGKTLLAMPEGTSRHEGLIIAKRKGLARLAMQGDYAITPAAVSYAAHAISDGLRTWFNRLQRLWDRLRNRPPRPKIDTRHIITIRYGRSFFLKDHGLNQETDPTGERATTAIMVRIGALLPRDQWGDYASEIADFLKSEAPDAAYYRNRRTSLDHLG